jgi:ABC-type antimicrobial peptide transport system permease subunit
MIKQLNYLHRIENLGFDFKNTAQFRSSEDPTVLQYKLQQIPEIEQVLTNNFTLMPRTARGIRNIVDWDDRNSGSEERIEFAGYYISEALVDFYKIQLVAGEFLSDSDSDNDVLIDEWTAKYLGWDNPVGTMLRPEVSPAYSRVKGVIRNIHSDPPTMPTQPTLYTARSTFPWSIDNVAVRYREGKLSIVREKLREVLDNSYNGNLTLADETYDGYIKSEKSLMKLLGFASLVCILISVFGFFSLVSLTCEERRKEIAIRKVSGATINDILSMFFKEYFLLLFIGALIAFPIGYYVMKRWLEQYVLQTAISAWIYIAILFALTFVIVLCVGWRVWRTSIENPADVVKSE